MSILNVNQIQPVGGGNTITVTASDVSASGATITATSFVGSLTGNVTGNVTSSSTSTFSSGINVTGGSVGIGTDNPSQLLHLHSDSEHQILLKRGGQYPSECKFSNSGNLLTISNNVNGIQFDVGSSSLGTAMYIEDGGNIGIATDNPASILHVRNTAPVITTEATNNSSGLRLNVLGQSSSTSQLFRVQNDNTTKLTISKNGNVTIDDGNLVLASGHGIDFSATTDASGMSSELLDDYEEGIHTVAFTASTGGSVTVSSGNDQVSYVKIGNHVTVTGRPVITSVSSPQGNLRMTLPFTSADLSDSAGRAACALNVRLLNSGYKVGMMSAYLDEGSNLLNFSYGDNNDSQNSAPAVKTGTQIWINISYRTT